MLPLVVKAHSPPTNTRSSAAMHAGLSPHPWLPIPTAVEAHRPQKKVSHAAFKDELRRLVRSQLSCF